MKINEIHARSLVMTHFCRCVTISDVRRELHVPHASSEAFLARLEIMCYG